MLKCSSSYIPTSASISKFISEQPFLSLLETKCSTMKDLKMIHAQLIKTGLIKDKIAASRVLAFCATSPAYDMNYAYLVFSQIDNPNLFIWNIILRGFSQSSVPEIALSIFIDMLESSPIQPDRLTYPSVFQAYTQLGLAAEGAQLHGRIVKVGLEFEPYIRNTMLNMYANSGFLNEAGKLFNEDEDGVEDVVAWNIMISGFAQCGEIDNSWRLFNKMTFRNHVSWNSMISGFVKNGKWKEAFDLFNEMQEQRIESSGYTLVSLLNASAFLGALEQGKWIHECIMRKKNIKMNAIGITALINMYCKCGDIEMARQVFETSRGKGLSCWNSMIFGLAINGFENEAIQLFSRLQSSNLEPDCVSFLSVLTACNHSGLVDEARHYFTLMKDTYKIEPSVKHFGCIVDTLGRAGLLEEAEVLIKSMPTNPDICIWGSLLSAAHSHGNFEIAHRAAKHLVELDQDDTSSYLLMSNAYAESGHFEKAMQERSSMKEKQIKKQPGCSSIEVDGEVHEFVAGGMLHNRANEIYSLLH